MFNNLKTKVIKDVLNNKSEDNDNLSIKSKYFMCSLVW